MEHKGEKTKGGYVLKLAVIGLYYALNLGDAVICDCVIKWLQNEYPNAKIDLVDIEGKKGFVYTPPSSIRNLYIRQWKLRGEYWLTQKGICDRIYYWNKVDIESRQMFYDHVASQEYDGVIFAGGQLFMDWLSLDIVEFLKRFRLKKIPVFFNACGAGISVSTEIQKQLAKELLDENVKFISSRDDVRKIEQRYLFGQKTVQRTFDPALWSNSTYPVYTNQTVAVGLGIMNCSEIGYRKLIHFWIGLIREIEKRGIQWKLFCNGDPDDYRLCSYILNKLNRDQNQYLCPRPQTPQELVNTIAAFQSMITFRLHSHIIGSSFYIPAVAIVWDEKIRFFYRQLGLEERCMEIKDQPNIILNRLEEAVKLNYKKEIIESQKQYSHSLLLKAINHHFCRYDTGENKYEQKR